MSGGSLFERFCIRGLERMYLRKENVFSASYRMKDGQMTNVRNPDSEYMYSMNTLMGLHKAKLAGCEVFVDIESVYSALAAGLDCRNPSTESVAATVWAGNSIGCQIPPAAKTLFEGLVSSASRSDELSAQAVAWAITACVSGGTNYHEVAADLAQYSRERYVNHAGVLVRHTVSGVRKNWASFAASCYMAYAFLLVGEALKDETMRKTGLEIARTLVGLQGPQGQWAWFYHVPTGRVADYYPIYSVHQHAMAPFFLIEAIDQGYSEFRKPLERGFRWILGYNELNQSMINHHYGVIWRSLVRRGPFPKVFRSIRSIGVRYAGLASTVERPDVLYINTECRSYELGWALWAFAGRRDFDELLNHSSFIAPDCVA